MAEVLADRGRLHKQANEALDQNLVPGETVEVIITGPSSQAVIGTNRRAFVYKKGFMAGATFGSQLTSWDYRNLVGVQLHTGRMSGAVVLQAPGQAGTSTSYWNTKDSDPYKAPNAIPVLRPWDQAQAGVARLRELIDASQSPHVSPQGGASAGWLAKQSMVPTTPDPSFDRTGDRLSGGPSVQLLRDLSELRDAGVLTHEEFEVKKAEVLRRL